MASFFDDVMAFHELFKVTIGEKCEIPDLEEQELRLRLIAEEYEELRLAHDASDIIEIADALADLIYVACGMAVAYGIPLNEVYAEVQRSNMAKVGEDGEPIYRSDGKVLKPEGWTPPDIARVLREFPPS
jgi:predicted HAD superfamily Cof-like phosphohydrolase